MDRSTAKSKLPDTITSIENLEELLSRPTPELTAELGALDGDIIILGAGGKIGPSLARMAKRACPEKKVYAVARFSNSGIADALAADGIEVVKADLMDRQAIEKLPNAANVMFLAGQKFGSSGAQSLTWAMNSFMPGLVAERFRDSRIVAFSTGCVYPFVSVISGGASEDLSPNPPGEYAMSCIGRERIFEYFSQRHNTPGRLFRLNYAVDLRYGVLVDIARKVLAGETIDVTMGHVNVIWQGDANVMALRSLAHTTPVTSPINVSGPETIAIRWVAEAFARRFNKKAVITGTEAEYAWLTNTAHANKLFGYPRVPLDLLMDWVADWLVNKREVYDKPTKFEVRDGNY
ncbi:NAD-dependent epimerase/dehydratase family protein [Sneathiella sp.]|uniref:NAD-dependent epimerase/dehydratase family protein n=1 Tax=Sneathiella sp. TaxID=1964365 RepID=UPI003566B68D